MKIPSIKVHSVEGYFQLPKADREFHGLYRKPYALPLGFLCGRRFGKEQGWSDWEARIRKEYPLQWFFREWLTSWDNPVYALVTQIRMRYSDIHYNVKRFISPLYPRFRKAFPRHAYKEISVASVEINFALILDFWYEEVVDGCVDWQADEMHSTFYDSLKCCVDYIEKIRPELNALMDEALTAATDDERELPYEQRYAEYNRLEKMIEDTDTKTLIWFIQHRDSFWS